MTESCVRCGKPAAGRVPIYGAIPLSSFRPLAPLPTDPVTGQQYIRTEWVHGDRFGVFRDEPWCRDCGQRTIDANPGEYVWRSTTRGWPGDPPPRRWTWLRWLPAAVMALLMVAVLVWVGSRPLADVSASLTGFALEALFGIGLIGALHLAIDG